MPSTAGSPTGWPPWASTTVVVDAGVRPPESFGGPPDVDQTRVASAGGHELAGLAGQGDRGAAVTAMGEGAAAVLAELLAADGLDGVLALGGSGGSSIAARAVRDLPIGLPKLHRLDHGVRRRLALRRRRATSR